MSTEVVPTATKTPRRRRSSIAPSAIALQVDLTSAEAMTGLSKRTLRLWASMKWSPVRRAGRKLLFSVADLQAWVAAGSPPPTQAKSSRSRKAAKPAETTTAS
jgi:hypothetical protein